MTYCKFRNSYVFYDFSYIWNLKNKTNEQTKFKQAQRHRGLFDGCQRGGGEEDWVKKVKG